MAASQFSSARFKRLLMTYFAENGRMLTRALIAFMIISIALWLVITGVLISNDEGFFIGIQIFLFVINAFIFPLFASGWFYGRLNSAERQISFLVIPSTHFEKHLLSTLMSFVLPLFVGILTYYIGEIISMGLHSNLAAPSHHYSDYFNNTFFGVPLFKEIMDTDVTTLICFCYISFLGFGMAFMQFFTLHFTRYIVFKLVLLLLSLATFISLFIYLTLETLDVNDNSLFRYCSHLFDPSQTYSDTEVLLFAIPCLISALVLWFASYIRLKEYQLK